MRMKDDPFVLTDRMLENIREQSCENDDEGTDCYFDDMVCVKVTYNPTSEYAKWCVDVSYYDYLPMFSWANDFTFEILDSAIKIGASLASIIVLAGLF